MAQQAINRTVVPTSGLWTSAPGDAIAPQYTPWCQNVRFRFGKVLRSPGRSVVLDQGLSGSIMDFATHFDANGNRHIIALGASSLSNGYAALYNPTTFKFTLLGLLQVTSLQDLRFSWAMGEEQLFIARASQISRLSLRSINDYNLGQFAPTPTGCYLAYFKNHLFCANILADPISIPVGNNASSGPMPNRIRWSAEGDYRNWNMGIQGDGTVAGGFLDLYDGIVEPITGMKVLNDRLVVYRNSSITDLNATGDALTQFLPENRVFGIGCMLPWSLASVGQFHIFVGNDFNIYAWDGSNLDPIGSPIHSYVRQVLNFAGSSGWQSIPFAAAFMGFKEYWLVIPDPVGGTYNVLIYDYFRNAWTHDVFTGLSALFEQILPGSMSSAGWDGDNYPVNYPVLMAASGNKYFMIDERVKGDWLDRPTDGGMDMFWDTPDMYYAPTGLLNGTLERVLVFKDLPILAGLEAPFNLEISIDRGNSFPYVETIKPINEHWGFEFTDMNITSNIRRYRFFYPKENGVATPSVRAYTDVYVPSGEFFPTIRALNPPDANLPPPNLN